MPVGGYLDKLEKDFNIIRRVRPFGSKEGSRSNKYLIEDNFLNLWFRFIYKFRSAVEISNLAYIRDIAVRDYEGLKLFYHVPTHYNHEIQVSTRFSL